MATIDELKELDVTSTPLFLFECTLRNGSVERWGTHAVSFEGQAYPARLLRHNLFELRSSADDGFDGTAKVASRWQTRTHISRRLNAKQDSKAGLGSQSSFYFSI